MIGSRDRVRLALGLLLAAATLGSLCGVTLAAFSATTANSGNSFQAGSWCSSPGTQTASSSADSWIDQASSSANFGADSILKVRSLTGSSNMRALVRFALPALPSGCSVTSATLRLFASSSTTGRTLQAFRINASWTEGGVTWANQPATTGTAATTASGSGWREWTVTSQVQSMYAGSNNGFLVRDQTEGSTGGAEQQLHAREKAPDNPPQLVITFG